MEDQELKVLMQFFRDHHDELFGEVRGHQHRPSSRRRVVLRVGTFVVVFGVCATATYFIHYEGVLKGLEFVGAAVADKLIFGLGEV